MTSADASARSSYLQWLPPVLWRDESDASVSLGSTLRIFEKLLTGIDDDVTLEHATHKHPPLAEQISALHQVFDPWATPATGDRDFLSWLAARLDLTFPTVYEKDLWDEYQRRNATAKVASIYRQRGLKAGLSAYLDLYAAGRLRPRVAIDDGARILAVLPQRSEWAAVSGLVTQGPVLAADRSVREEGLMRPGCLAVGPDGSVFAGETPLPPGIALPGVKSRVWRFTPAGEYRCATTPPEGPAATVVFTAPRRQPLAPNTLSPVEIRAVAVAPARDGRPETVYVLEPSGRLTAVRAPYERTGVNPVAAADRIGNLVAGGTSITPVAMSVDPPTGNLLVLDRGDGPGTATPPGIFTVVLDPFTVSRTSLASLIEPLSLLVEPDGSLLIGDGGVQEAPTHAELAATLIRIVRSGALWTETTVLPAGSSLRAPTGLARTIDGTLYVLDAGLKPLQSTAFSRAAADPACIYHVEEGGTPRLSPITRPGSFVYPVGLAASGARLLVADRGEIGADAQQPSWTRVKPFEFDVVIHWPEPRLPEDLDRRHQLLARVVSDIEAVVEQQKPAHSVMNLVTDF